ncbi:MULTISPECIES: DUF2835 domain-containing protein [unclassified Vibrio]|uniref:DUF2835 domain-containing protein n=1 Tax=Vibrio sp. HB236076 TaxID=3232307 RepID=A0AB39H6C1_9VIBR|nr:DUF2835 domain-containing protein [Vibrio sp. HB161653]MDP5253391.1 DUF2835 domain-containing protein [Vibrio sp. HB161653]
MNHRYYFFSVRLTYQEFLHYYQGNVSHVQVRLTTGQQLQLPAARLRPFLSHSGINGQFRLTTDERNKFIRLERL